MPSQDQRIININRLIGIRDDEKVSPAIRLQAIQTMQKLIDKDNPETTNNILILKKLRDSDETGNGVRIQVIQTLQKIINLVEGEYDPNKPSAQNILAKIRSAKK